MESLKSDNITVISTHVKVEKISPERKSGGCLLNELMSSSD